MAVTQYRMLKSTRPEYWIVLALLGVLTVVGYFAAHYMDSNGHYVTGMSNQIVWGIPHVFAIFLILSASGALNVASMASVFGKESYKALARLSGLLAIALLIGGLLILVLDLGRPERLIVAMTYYNFKSIFAWNIFLYTGFVFIVIVYLWTMFEPRMEGYTRPFGMFAFFWRFILTTGTGSIFGFLVARQAYDVAIMAPLFIVISLTAGTSVFVLVLVAVYRWYERTLDNEILQRLGKLLGWFVAASLYLTFIYHLTNLYISEHYGIERFILWDGGIYTFLFWAVQVGLGGVVPLGLLFASERQNFTRALLASAWLIIAGVVAQLCIIIIGGQAYPLTLFPGFEVSSNFYDGVVAGYTPSLPEILLGISGVAVALLLLILVMRVLPFLPEKLTVTRR